MGFNSGFKGLNTPWRNKQCEMAADVRFQLLLCSDNVNATLRYRLARYLKFMNVTTP